MGHIVPFAFIFWNPLFHKRDIGRVVRDRCERGFLPIDLELMMRRDPLPPIFNSLSEVLDVPEGMVGRGKLVLKHKTAEELMKYTRCDES